MCDRRHKWKEHNVDPANTDTTKATAAATETQILANNDSQSLASSPKRKISASSGAFYPHAKFVKIRPQPTVQENEKKQRKLDMVPRLQQEGLERAQPVQVPKAQAQQEKFPLTAKQVDRNNKVANNDAKHAVNDVNLRQKASDKGLQEDRLEIGDTETKDAKVMVC